MNFAGGNMLVPKAIKFSNPSDIFYSDNISMNVVGCGGNGSWFIPHLCRIVIEYQKKYPQKHIEITLYDGDKVEPKNVGRQNFILKDVGLYKSEVLATRYGSAYGLDIRYVTDFIKINTYGDVMFGCVDNVATRKLLSGRVIFDVGNEKDFGQILIKSQLRMGGTTPSFSQVFPDAREDKQPDEMSCAELLESAPQSLMINSLGAILMATAFQSFLQGDLDYFMINYNLHGYVDYVKNTIHNLKPYLSGYVSNQMDTWYSHFKIGKVLYPINKLPGFLKEKKLCVTMVDGEYQFKERSD